MLEDKTEGWYAPSPGIVYPTLTYLEEAGYVTAQTDGAKRLYTITGEGRAYLESNRAFVDAVLERLDAVGERMRARRGEDDDTPPRTEGAAAGPRRPGEPLRGRAPSRLKERRRCGSQGRRCAGPRGGAEMKKKLSASRSARGRSRARRPRAAGRRRGRSPRLRLRPNRRRLPERVRHIELIAAAPPIETRPTSTAEPPEGRTRTTAPRCAAGALRVTAMLISSITTAALFAAAGICTDMRAGDSAVAVPPAVARLDSATIHSIRTSSGSAQSSTRLQREMFFRYRSAGGVRIRCS